MEKGRREGVSTGFCEVIQGCTDLKFSCHYEETISCIMYPYCGKRSV